MVGSSNTLPGTESAEGAGGAAHESVGRQLIQSRWPAQAQQGCEGEGKGAGRGHRRSTSGDIALTRTLGRAARHARSCSRRLSPPLSAAMPSAHLPDGRRPDGGRAAGHKKAPPGRDAAGKVREPPGQLTEEMAATHGRSFAVVSPA